MATNNVIELLLKAVDEASPVLKELANTMGQTEQASKGAGEAGSEAGQKTEKASKEAEGAARDLERQIRASEAALLGVAVVAGTAFAGVVAWVKASTTEYNRQTAALMGLASEAGAVGKTFDEVTVAAVRLSADGLMSLGEAARSLRNLLATGYGLDEAILIMERLKDSAAFGRQGFLSFGQAVMTATEGIKNGNSILVDNAGVTKNLSVMLVEAGLSASDLVRAGDDLAVRQAILNGILRETASQAGNAARLSNTLAGAEARAQTATAALHKEMGEALSPALKVITEQFADGVSGLAEWVSHNQDLATGIVVTAGTFTGLFATIVTVKKGLDLLKAAQKSYNLVLFGTKMALGEVALIATAVASVVGILAAVFRGNTRAAQEAADAELEAAIKAARAEQDRADTTIAALESIADAEGRVADARIRAEDEARRESVKQIDWLYDHLVAALRKRYDAQKKAADDALRAEESAARTAYDQRIKMLDAETKAFVASRQLRIDAIDAEVAALDRVQADEDAEERIRKLQEELLRTSDPEQARRLTEQIEDVRNETARRKQREALQDAKRSLQEEIDARKDSADAQKRMMEEQWALQQNAMERQRTVLSDHFGQLLDAQRIQGEAEQLILEDNQAAMVEVLKAYAPEYFTLGKSFGERLIAGYVGTQPDYVAALDYSMNYARNATAIIEAAADRAEAEARRVEDAARRAQAAAEALERVPDVVPMDLPPGLANRLPNYYTPHSGGYAGDRPQNPGTDINIYGNVEVKADRIDDPKKLADEIAQRMKWERWLGVPSFVR